MVIHQKNFILGATSLLLGSLASLFLLTPHKREALMSTHQPLEETLVDLEKPEKSLDFDITSSLRSGLTSEIIPSSQTSSSVFQGITFDADDSMPIPSTAITFTGPLTSQQDANECDLRTTTVSQSDGTFDVSLFPGPYFVTLRPPTTHILTQLHVNVGYDPLHFFLEKGVTLEGIVQDFSDNHVSGAEIYLLNGHPGKRAGLKVLGSYDQPAAITGSDGAYYISGVKRGYPIILFGHHDSFYQVNPYLTIYFEDYPEDQNTFSLDPLIMTDKLSHVALNFTDWQGVGDITSILSTPFAVKDSPLHLERNSSNNFISSFTFDHLPPGYYQLNVTRNGSAPWKSDYFYLLGEKTFTVPLVSAYTVNGMIFEEGVPRRNLPITLEATKDNAFSYRKLETLTNDQGIFSFDGIPSGNYLLSAGIAISTTKEITVLGNTSLSPLEFTRR